MEISHADRGTINMKHIKRDFRSKACVLPLWVNLVVGVKRSKFNFSEHGHVAYQIKENRECSNIVVNILPADPPPTPTLGMWSIGLNSTFSEHGHVAYQSKGNHLMQQHGSKYFTRRPSPPPPPPPSPNPPPRGPWGWGQLVKIQFF